MSVARTFAPDFLADLRARIPLAPLVERNHKLVRAGREWKCCCPFHDEKTPSFHVYRDHYHCYGCGAHGDQIEFLRRTEGIDFTDAVERLAAEAGMDTALRSGNGARRGEVWEPMVPAPADAPKPTEAQFKHKGRAPAVPPFEYYDAEDQLMHYERRFETKDGKKFFLPLTWGRFIDEHGKVTVGWHNRAPLPPRPLYGLNRLSHAPKDTTVILCEGPGKADAVMRMAQRDGSNYVGMSWGSSSGDGSVDLTPLGGWPVILWGDADKSGRDCVARLSKRLPSARTVDTTGLEAIKEGFDAKDLELTEAADDFDAWLRPKLREPEPQSQPNGLPPLLSARAFMSTFKSPDYIIDGIIQRGRLYALTSPTAHGKTAVCLYAGCYIAAERNIGNIEVAPGAVVFLAGENPDDLCCRFHAACQSYGLNPDKLPVHFMPGNFPITADAAELLKQRINATGIHPILIIADTAAAYFQGDDDNDNVQKGAFARNLRVLTTCNGYPAVLTPTHPIKRADKDNLVPAGGGAFLNELDGNLTLWSDVLGESATLHWHAKLRGADFTPVNFALTQVRIDGLTDKRGRPIVSIVATLQSDEQAENAAKAAISEENTVLEWLRRYPGITLRDIACNAGWMTPGGQANVWKVTRLLKSLRREKLVEVRRKKWRITTSGVSELEAK
jgi:hypothetical protein